MVIAPLCLLQPAYILKIKGKKSKGNKMKTCGHCGKSDIPNFAEVCGDCGAEYRYGNPPINFFIPIAPMALGYFIYRASGDSPVKYLGILFMVVAVFTVIGLIHDRKKGKLWYRKRDR